MMCNRGEIRALFTTVQLVLHITKLWGSVNIGRIHKPSKLKYSCISINNIIQHGKARSFSLIQNELEDLS